MEKNPLVSVVIPVFNGSAYIREAIDSALAQTYKNIEVMVVNDGSTDNTDEIAKSYGNKIRYLSKENGGVSSALNLAIKKAKGDYISWLSHDDIYFPEKLETQLQKLSGLEKKEQHGTILYSNYIFINDKAEEVGNTGYQKIHNSDKLNDSLYPLLNGLVNGCTLLIPKICFERDGYFNETLRATQDYDLWFKMFPKYNLIFMEDELIESRVHEKQGSRTESTRSDELDNLWMKMVKGVSSGERTRIYGSEAKFYAKVYRYVKSSKRSRKVEEYLYGKCEELLAELSSEPNLNIANMATYPARKESLEITVSSILPQVDFLNIYLNEYEEIPEFLKDPFINCVLGKEAKGDLRDNGKFYFLEKVPESAIYFALDDDIIYPPDYVVKMLEELENNDYRTVLGVHGIIFKSNFESFARSRITFHFSRPLRYSLNASCLGTGTVVFRKALVKDLNLLCFKTPGMADLWLGVFCKNQKIAMVATKRKANWLVPVNLKQENTLWIEGSNSQDQQNEIIRENRLWEFENSLTEQTLSKIKVSVVIPFYNRPKETTEAIKSALAQTHHRLEIIAIDDKSTVGLKEIKEIVKSDNRIKLVKNTHRKGAGGARNTGIDLATGEYIAFLDSDDLFLPEKITEQLSFMVFNEYDFSFTSYGTFSAESEKEISIKDIAGQNLYFPSIICGCLAATPTVMVRSDMFENKDNRFPEEFKHGQDVALWIRLSKTSPCYGLNKVLSIVRFSGDNVVLNQEKEALGMQNILKYVIENFLDQNSIEATNALYRRFVRFGGENSEIDQRMRDELNKIPITTRTKRKVKRTLVGLKTVFKNFVKFVVRQVSPSFRDSENMRKEINMMEKKLDFFEISFKQEIRKFEDAIGKRKNE